MERVQAVGACDYVPPCYRHIKLEQWMEVSCTSHCEHFTIVCDERAVHVGGDVQYIHVAKGCHGCVISVKGVLGFLVHSKCVADS